MMLCNLTERADEDLNSITYIVYEIVRELRLAYACSREQSAVHIGRRGSHGAEGEKSTEWGGRARRDFGISYTSNVLTMWFEIGRLIFTS